MLQALQGVTEGTGVADAIPMHPRCKRGRVGGISHVDVCDLLGQVLISNDYNATEVTINTELLPAGVYAVKVRDAEGVMMVGKVVKQ